MKNKEKMKNAWIQRTSMILVLIAIAALTGCGSTSGGGSSCCTVPAPSGN